MAIDGHLKAIENEFKKIEDNSAWHQVYQKVRAEGTYDSSVAVAKLPQNKNLNRYRDVLPYDHSRIVLQGCGSDYVNASLVEVSKINRNYILCQGPLSHTSPHFWLMVWQQNCKGIVMLNKIIEKNTVKCHQYWPLGSKRGGEDHFVYDSVSLKIELIKEACHSNYIYRTLRVTNTCSKENREILHFHYTTWPDFGVPQSPEAFYQFLSIVRSSQCLEPQYGPAIIHCSAGIGRSGTFCLVDSILKMLVNGLCSEEPGKVLEVLLDMRKHRMGLIQTSDQLRFVYQAIILGGNKTDEVNGKDPSEESSCEDSVEEPPPVPPVRTLSLNRVPSSSGAIFGESSSEELDTSEDEHDDLEDEEEEDQKLLVKLKNEENNRHVERPLPDEPSSPESSPDSRQPLQPPSPSSSHEDDEESFERPAKRLKES